MKLNKLPDREVTRITFTANAELKTELQDYAEIYRRTYNGKETIADLIPFMLETFINTDHAFKRARKELADARVSTPSTQTKET